MTAFFILLGLWRCWLGRGIGDGWPFKSGITYLQYAAALVLVYLATLHDPWYVTLIDAVGVIGLARGYGHRPMLGYPLVADIDGDFILKLVGGPGGGFWRWLLYADLRYLLPAVLWGGALMLVGAPCLGPVVGAVWIIATYFVFISGKVPRFAGLLPANCAEIVGWTGLGLAMAVL